MRKCNERERGEKKGDSYSMIKKLRLTNQTDERRQGEFGKVELTLNIKGTPRANYQVSK